MLIGVDDGTVPLTLADIKALEKTERAAEINDEGEGSGSDDEKDSAIELVDDESTSQTPSLLSVKTERIILRNTARHHAIQINAALGDDIWKELNRLVVKDNIAEDNAMQLNYGVTAEMGLRLLDIQSQRIGAKSVK